jgi:hypothetical protein
VGYPRETKERLQLQHNIDYSSFGLSLSAVRLDLRYLKRRNPGPKQSRPDQSQVWKRILSYSIIHINFTSSERLTLNHQTSIIKAIESLDTRRIKQPSQAFP